MNPVWRDYAYKARVEAALEGEAPPNRKQLRDRLRQFAPPYYRRAIFGVWRRQWGLDG